MTKRTRLDAELVRRGLARSRAEAKALIDRGEVAVRGIPVARASTLVSAGNAIELERDLPPFVSRGGEKLDAALDRLEVAVAGRRWLDAGASTGGFTDRLLRGGALEVIAVDVGYGQLDWSLRNDARVHVLERRNVRALTSDDLPWRPDAVTADLSFISLTTVLPALAEITVEDADLVVLVKPQFEVGRDAVGRGGVVRDPVLWRKAILKVVTGAARCDLGVVAVVAAWPPGPAGNREFFVHLRRGVTTDRSELEAAIGEAISEAAA